MYRRGDLCNRRYFMRVPALVYPVVSALGQADFWNSKGPADYTEEEKRQIITNSPWAKTVRAKGLIARSKVSPMASAGVGSPCPIPGASGTSPVIIAQSTACNDGTKENAGAADSKHSLAFYGQVTVRWESAAPLLQITGIPLPDEFRDDYVISVTGLPTPLLTEMPVATLSSSSNKHRHISAQFVRLLDKQALFFAFPHHGLPLKTGNITIGFTMHLSGITVTAQFNPEDMMYRGRLAL
jgi:hypothetical protein